MSFSPWILGAFVRPAEKHHEDVLTYRERSHIYGAGIIANIVFALILFGAYHTIRFAETAWSGESFWFALVCFLGAHFVMKFGKQISSWVLPIVSIILTGLIIYWLLGMTFQEIASSVGGPVSIVTMTNELVVDMKKVLLMGAFISGSLALFNVLPLIPMDGGHTWSAILEHVAPSWVKRFHALGAIIFLILIGVALSNDIRILFR